jgi:HAD superfamily hydrolase (TIGR01509 family)
MTGNEYDHKKVEKKWREKWEETNLYKTPELKSNLEKKKYILETFPYPSGDGLHVGHTVGYTASDITARYSRMNGYKVLYPFGFDAFGLPAENYAIKKGQHPRITTDIAIANFTSQVSGLGASYDWKRVIATHRPEYYKWTQWLFELLYKRGLAYKKEALVNWDPVDQTVLANEQVLSDGTAERSGAKVEQKLLSQWFFKITDYAERLLDGLDNLDWPESTKLMQKNWIGKSEGAEVDFYGFVKREYAYSYVVGVKESFKKNFREMNGIIEEEITDSTYKVKFENAKKDDFIQLISNELKSNCWNEFICEGKIYFQFKELNQKNEEMVTKLVYSKQDNDKILEICNRIAKKEFKNILKMLYDNDFYKNIIFKVTVFTTRIDTLYSGTFIILAPEHPLVDKISTKDKKVEIEEYQNLTKTKSQLQRTDLNDSKTGVFTGVYVINPASGFEMPVWISDFVLGSYGTGAVFADAHDERDYYLAKKYNIPLKESIAYSKIYPFEDNKTLEIRKTIRAIVKHWDEDKYLLVKEKKFDNIVTLVGGGVEDTDDNKDEAIKREVSEETGYNDFKTVHIQPFQFQNNFYNMKKDRNQISLVYAAYVELNSDSKIQVSQKELETIEVVWVKKEELLQSLEAEQDRYLVDRIILDKPFCGEGILFNSQEFDGLSSAEARVAITKFGEEQNWAKPKITYRLRDWLVSRQRYWGSPIPVIYQADKFKVVFASTNIDKIERFKKITTGLNLEILTLKDVNLDLIQESIESGINEMDNANIKAQYYWSKLSYKYPVIAQDDGVYLDTIDQEYCPGKNVKKTVEKHMGEIKSQQTIFDYWKMIVEKFKNPEIKYNWSFSFFDGQKLENAQLFVNGNLSYNDNTNYQKYIDNGAPLSPLTMVKVSDEFKCFADFSSSDYQNYFGNNLKLLNEKLQSLVHKNQTANSNKTILIDAINCLFQIRNDKIELNKELADFLNKLPCKKIILTNAKEDILSQMRSLVKDYAFELYSLEFNLEKSNPEYYKKAIKDLNIDLKSTIYFDDSAVNIISAKSNAVLSYQYLNNQQFIQITEDWIKGVSLVPEIDLPVILPENVEFHPTGRSPLYNHLEFQQSAKDLYGQDVLREIDTMDTFVCSSWYFFRYCSPQNTESFADIEEMKKWMPIDQYIIGAEHSVLHLLYARFFTKALFDAGFIEFDEPFTKMRHQGLLIGEDNRKMSKRWGNVINPNIIYEQFGADTLRMYLMFMGPFEQSQPWNTNTVKGVKRFIDRVWKMQFKIPKNPQMEWGPKKEFLVEKALNQLISKVTTDIENFSFNTSVAEFMKFVNTVDEVGGLLQDQYKSFLICLAPFAPYITEEIYHRIDFSDKYESIHLESWLKVKDLQLKHEEVKMVIQINGKVRATFEIAKDSDDDLVIELAKKTAIKYLENKEVTFIKVIPNKLVSIVIK